MALPSIMAAATVKGTTAGRASLYAYMTDSNAQSIWHFARLWWAYMFKELLIKGNFNESY
jgi:hypothetical protein